MKKSQLNIILTAGVVTFLLFSGCVSGIVSTFQSTTTDTLRQKNTQTNENAIITCYVSGIPHSQTIPYESGIYLKELFSELVTANAHDSCSADTQRLQRQILLYAEQQGLLPVGMSADMVFAQLGKQGQRFASQDNGDRLPLSGAGTGREMFCNFVATGEGSAFPIIILPRFIPFIMTPIPRLFVGWKTSVGFTSVGGLMSGTGFYAAGQQQGFALGFWGIGFSIFLPPVRAYGMFGYALYAKASAEYMEYYPPNNPPEITQTDPADGQQMVPTTLTELRFEIDDLDNDLMSYNVTTEPDIGSGSGGLKPGGTYSIPVSGLESLTNYTWFIQVTDGKDTVNKICSFETEPSAPKISNPSPEDGERDVPMNLPHLQFTLKDYQGDAMEYTVQTSPNIGSQHEAGVHDGTIKVPISGMVYGALYRWYVNVTDGTHWARKTYSFTTGYPSPFDPFDYGWQYRKQITIDHTQVTGDLVNFPVLISTTDPDLIKAQTDGDDLLIMDSIGAAIKLRHEIEFFDQAAGVLVAWVNVPSLSSVEDMVLYVYYGNPDCINQQYPEKTWDSHYVGVWHMNDVTSSTIADSTLNDNNGVKIESNGPMQSIGKIGYGQVFDGNNDYINCGHDSSLSLTGAISLESWIYYSGVSNPIYPPDAIGKSTTKTGYGIQVDTDSGTFLRAGTGAWYDSPRHPQSTDTWYHVVGVYDGSYLRLYINGAEISPATSYTKGFTANSADALMGKHYDNTGFINGRLDEIRVSNVIRTSTWISTEYANHNNPDGFLSIGPEEPGP